MKRVILFLSVFSYCILLKAQPYSISFAGTGLSTVKVQNLTTGVIVDVPVGDVLLLSTPTGIPEVKNIKSSVLKVYPNPMTGISTLEILPPVDGDIIISVCDMTGKVLTQLKAYVDKHIQEFSLSGIKNGLHIINVQGNGYQFSEKLLSNGKSNGTAIIARLSNNIQASAEKKSLMDHKGVQATVDMAYHTGERLKYTAVSGNKSTVVVDVPIESKTITFNFIACTDGDGNNYPIVYIGQQIWMAENLKTTKFNDETSIDLGNPGNWTGRLTPAYWWYFLGDEAEIKNTYGLLYNWWAAATGKLCPSGWHVPTTTDYGKLLLNFHELISEAENIGGGKLKEFGLTHWNSPNTGATDETGFTALPGGRIGTGSCEYIGTDGYWWFSDSFEEYFTRCLQINYNTTQIISGINWPKYYGFSIRCIKDE